MSITFHEVEKIFHENYLMVDPGIIKVALGTVIANQLMSDPFWLFIVAQSGGMKSEIITSLSQSKKVYPLSSLTAQTFISGQQSKEEEKSLLFKINYQTMSFKDFTTILSLHQEERKAIMSQFREIYDGNLKKAFGTGKESDWSGKVGFIAGVTYEIYAARELYAAMGERFVMYSLIQPDRKGGARRSMKNQKSIKEIRERTSAAVAEYLDNFEVGATLDMPDELEEELVDLAELATRVRSVVQRNFRSAKQEITAVHPPEMPTRFAAELSTIANAFMMMNQGALTQDDKNILYKITLDSMTFMRRKCLQELVRYKEVDTAALAVKMNLPTDTINKKLEELNVLEVVDRIHHGQGHANTWKLRNEYRPLLEKFEKIKMLDHSLLDVPEEMMDARETVIDADTDLSSFYDGNAPSSPQPAEQGTLDPAGTSPDTIGGTTA